MSNKRNKANKEEKIFEIPPTPPLFPIPFTNNKYFIKRFDGDEPIFTSDNPLEEFINELEEINKGRTKEERDEILMKIIKRKRKEREEKDKRIRDLLADDADSKL